MTLIPCSRCQEYNLRSARHCAVCGTRLDRQPTGDLNSPSIASQIDLTNWET
jgi:hypothetical protein